MRIPAYRALCIVSFIIYALSALALRENTYAQFYPENFAIATAISHVVYGAPIGKPYLGVMAQIVYQAHGPDTIQHYMTQALALHNLDRLEVFNPDGNGFAYTLFATIAMQILGAHLSSLAVGFLFLIGISTFIFCLRYSDDRLGAILLYFLAMTTLNYSILSLPSIANEIAIGGMRYFALLAVLPALHLFWEIRELSEGGGKMPRLHCILAILQLALLLFTIMVRGSAGYALLMLLVVSLFLLRRSPGERRRQIVREAMPLVIAGVVFICAFHALAPAHYRHSGRVATSIWHRAIIGLGVNPKWPFGDLSRRFDCSKGFPTGYFPHGLAPGVTDADGYCLWAESMLHSGKTPIFTWYAQQHGLGYGRDNEYSTQYEATLREMFFRILFEYPRQTLKTFLYYKPLMIWDTLRQFPYFHLPGKTKPIRQFMGALLASQLALTLLFCALIPAASQTQKQLLFANCLLLLCVIPTYFPAWSVPHTSAEMLLFIISILGISFSIVINRVKYHYHYRQL